MFNNNFYCVEVGFDAVADGVSVDIGRVVHST